MINIDYYSFQQQELTLRQALHNTDQKLEAVKTDIEELMSHNDSAINNMKNEICNALQTIRSKQDAANDAMELLKHDKLTNKVMQPENNVDHVFLKTSSDTWSLATCNHLYRTCLAHDVLDHRTYTEKSHILPHFLSRGLLILIQQVVT